LNVATHSDGTITYSFGAEDEVPPVVASIPLATPNEHQEAPEATISAATSETNGATTTMAPPVAAVEQLDKLLHLTPELSNGRSFPTNGASENGNGASNGNGAGKVHSIEVTHHEDHSSNGSTSVESVEESEDESISLAKKLSEASKARKAEAVAATAHVATEKAPKVSPTPSSTSTSSPPSTNKGPLTPLTVDYRETPAVTIDRLYARLCDAGKLDDALLVVKECIRAGRDDVLKL
jgi:hypothetical protein